MIFAEFLRFSMDFESFIDIDRDFYRRMKNKIILIIYFKYPTRSYLDRNTVHIYVPYSYFIIL